MSHSATSSSSDSSPSPTSTPSSCTPQANIEPARMQVFHIEAPRDYHKLFVSTGPQPDLGFFFQVMHLPGLPQRLMFRCTDIVDSIEQLAAVHDSKLVGSVAANDYDRLRLMIASMGTPLAPADSDPPSEALHRAEQWVLGVIEKLLQNGILEAPPPQPTSTSGGHQLPRHHHTAHCVHQRLYSHHPYRRRGRQQPSNNAIADPSGSIQQR
ncbi:hypothetical protein FZEAL_9227 [Fusarium zealandicum]|uniref:Uncharacterized protein n=1 Tax=Fusarium zealandicum TaxID=1053134 RepID=A0A8H4UCS2_9HYPO|nr:hypothetical protein FZEAL_9227 [Fusarium zealandicum]